jgi:hypothetical protein
MQPENTKLIGTKTTERNKVEGRLENLRVAYYF